MPLCKARDLTTGPIVKNMLAFAVPLLLSSVAQQLYTTVDLLFAGNRLGDTATSALGVSSLLTTCLIGLFCGLSVGVNVVVAHLFGHKDLEQIRKALKQIAVIALISGMLIAFCCWISAPCYLQAMRVPDTIAADAARYLRLCCIALVPMLSFNVAAGASRALGDSSTPLLAQVIGGLTNIGANAVLLYVLNAGITGLALATTLSNALAAAITVIRVVRRQKEIESIAVPSDHYDHHVLREILSISIPAGVQSAIVTLSNVFVQYQIIALGGDAIAAFTIYFKVELPVYFAIVALGQTVTTFAAQNIGAENFERARKGGRTCQALSIAAALVIAGLTLLFGETLFGFFTDSNAIITYGARILHTTMPFYFLYAIMEVQAGLLRARGNSVGPMIVVILNICVLRTVLLALICAHTLSVEAIAAVYPLSWLGAALCMSLLHFCLGRATQTQARKNTQTHVQHS